MNFKELSDFLEGSIFPEEYRTNLQDAHLRIQRLESNPAPDSTVQDLACVHLLRALHAAMAGNLSLSDKCLDNMLALAVEAKDQALISRCHTFRLYIMCLKKAPPFLRFRSDANTNSGPIGDAELDMFWNKKKYTEIRSANLESWSPFERLESDVVTQIFEMPFNLWTRAFHHHPKYHTNFCAMLFDSYVPCASHFIGNTSRLGLKRTARYLQRVNAEYLLAGGSDTGHQKLSELYDSYIGDGDMIGAANCRMIWGDNLLSPPFTSPIALNMFTVDGGIGLKGGIGNLRESERLLRRNDASMVAYQQAFELFEDARAARGKAAIYLRYACLNFATYLESIANSKAATLSSLQSDEMLKSAGLYLDKAFELFEGDGANTQIVAGYKILLKIMRGNQRAAEDPYGNSIREAAEIGKWGRENGNLVVSQFVGLLIVCVGKKLSTDLRTIFMASHCFACARACFRGLGDFLLDLQALVLQAQLQQYHGNLAMARSYMETGQGVLSAAIDSLDGLISRTNLQDYRDTLKMMRNNRITDFDHIASSIYENDPRGERWKVQLDGLLHGSSLITALTNSLPDRLLANPTSNNRNPGARVSAQITGVLNGFSQEESPTENPDSIGSLVEMFKKFVASSTKSIDQVRQDFDSAVQKRREALVERADVDEAESHLRTFLATIRDASVNSLEVHTREAVALQYIGDFETARSLLPRSIPIMFGGQLPTSSDSVNAAALQDAQPDLIALQTVQIKQHARRSIAMCFIAKDWDLGATVLEKIRICLPQFFEEIETLGKDDSWDLMTWIACIEEQNGNLVGAFDWYLKALRVIETSRSRLADAKDRRDIFSTIHSGELFFGLSRIALRFSNLGISTEIGQGSEIWTFRGPTWRDEAVLFLEQGRARALLDLLIPEDVSAAFLDWSYQLRRNDLKTEATERPDVKLETLEDYLSKIVYDLKLEKESPSLALILEKLQIPYFGGNVTKLYYSIPADSIAILINVSRDGLLIICITDAGVELVHSSDMIDYEMEKHVLRYLKLFRQVDPDNLPSIENYEALLAVISIEIIMPIAEVIKRKSHVIFVPSRSLNKFPFSALLLDGKPIFLQKDISVVPSLSVLQHLVEREIKRKRKSSKQRNGAVIFKTPLKEQANGVNDQPLNISAAASIAISQLLNCQPRPAHTVGVHEFSSSYEKCDVMLVATHGMQGNKSGWQSSLSLKEPFQVLELVKLQGRAAIVIFEACVSGVGEESVGNDILGFSHSILSSGASSFLGSLWQVSDKASALLMSFYFVELMKYKSKASLARCLSRAQKQLYEADVNTIVSVLHEFKDACQRMGGEILPPRQLRSIVRAVGHAIEDEESGRHKIGQGYTHPFFWAPFILVGYGGLVL